MEGGLSASKADETELVSFSKLTRVVRFANSVIHQPMEERDVCFFIRVLKDGKMGFSSINGLDEPEFLKAIDTAVSNASLAKGAFPLHHFSPPVAIPSTNGCAKATAAADTEALEALTEKLLARGEGTGISFAGVFWTNSAELGVMNSNGVKRYHTWTAANCQTVAAKGDLAGFSAQASADLNAINPAQVGDAALGRALRFPSSIELPPGEYECLLEEYAVSDLLFYLAHMAFTGDAVEDGRSVIGLKKGKKIAGSPVTIWDDGTNPLSFQLPFDAEGMPRKKVTFIQNGVARDVVYDLATAARAGTESTGHALPADYSEGPLPLHLEMAPGTASKEEMIKQIKRGLLITRFHYIREVHALKTMITGMTRDGVFLIENGEIVARVKNFRFTESILNALSNVAALSKDRKLIAGEIDGTFPGAALVPKLLIKKFAFTGNTKF